MKRLLFLLALLLSLAPAASAHRLDEYLEATTIDVARDQITLRIQLTPGIAVVPKVLAMISPSPDGTFSPQTQRAYAARVLRDLSLELNGKPLTLRLTSLRFPSLSAIRNGVGTIELDFLAPTPKAAQNRVLTFENRHRPGIGVYLVNCLAPQDAGIQIVSQDRSINQSSYRLAMRIDPHRTGARTPNELASVQKGLDRASAGAMILAFFWHGVRHILTGYDHLLFVSALVLGASSLWDLVKVVTAFTVAHSITLTLAALNLAHLPSQIVEPFISGSIVFVAVQNIFWPEQARGSTRLAVAFFFGLFHGLGFAGGLLDLMHSMSSQAILLAILGFSLGVEAGNQMVLLPLFGLTRAVKRLGRDPDARRRVARAIQRFGSVGISLAGTVYFCLALRPS